MAGAPPEPPSGAANRRLADGRADLLVREEPLLLVIHGQQLLTMRTPGRDEDLALGFLLGEGIVARPQDVQTMRAEAGDMAAQRADELYVTLQKEPDPLVRSRLARTHEIRSSCGVCGIADPATVLEGTPPLLPGVPRVAASLLSALVRELHARQSLFAATGSSSPKVPMVMLPSATPRSIRAAFTAWARCRPSASLKVVLPSLSVCPRNRNSCSPLRSHPARKATSASRSVPSTWWSA